MVATTDTKDPAQYCVLCRPSSGLWWQRLIQRIGSTILCAVQTIEWIMVATTDTKDWKHNIVCCAYHRVDYGSND